MRACLGRLGFALTFALTSCAGGSPGPEPPPGAIEGTAPKEKPSKPGGQGRGKAGRPTRPAGPVTQPRATATRAGEGYRDHGPIGGMARAYLKSSPARRLVVEIDYVQERAPTSAALSHLRTVLRRETDKPGGVVIDVDQAIPPQGAPYDIGEIVRIEERYRRQYSGRDTATMWMVYLDGAFEGGEGALGLAYRGSSIALFPDRMESAASQLVNPGSIERAVLVHEIGHLMALVNIGYTSDYDHEDPDYPGHSRYRESVMYWAIDDISIGSILTGGPPNDFDRFDRADLDKLRTT